MNWDTKNGQLVEDLSVVGSHSFVRFSQEYKDHVRQTQSNVELDLKDRVVDQLDTADAKKQPS